jgi:hypothetical protein
VHFIISGSTAFVGPSPLFQFLNQSNKNIPQPVSLISHPIASFFHILVLRSVFQLPVTANVIPSSSIILILMMEAIRSSETSVLTREDCILQIIKNPIFPAQNPIPVL